MRSRKDMDMRRLRDDDGMAMVTAIMAGLVVLLLSTVGFQLTAHNLDQSANHRRDVQSVHAGEAGLDRFLQYLANEAPVGSPACSMATQGLSTTPVTRFAVTATYYWNEDLTGASVGPTACVFNPALGPPTFVVIRSTGTSAGVTRTMETKTQLLKNAGSSLATAAVYAEAGATWTGHASVSNAPGTELTADLYSNTSIELKGGGVLQGNVDAQGSITLSGQTDVRQNVTARGALSISNNAIVRGHARSSTSSVSNSGTINGNAFYCTGSAPGGTIAGAKVAECKPELPTARGFKRIGFTAADWSDPAADPAYTVLSYGSCAAAETALANLATGNFVIRATCSSLTLPAVTLRGHVAVIATGDIKGSGQTSIARVGSSPDYTLKLMANVPTSPATADPATCSSNSGISLSGGTTFPPNVDVLFYSPCDVRFTGNSTAAIQGQIISGRQVSFSSGSTITYKPVLVPGTNPVGFRQSVRYRSEIID